MPESYGAACGVDGVIVVNGSVVVEPNRCSLKVVVLI